MLFKILKTLVMCFFLSSVHGQGEKSSLTFVIDDTGSMDNDIRQVKEQVNDIFDTVKNSNSSQIDEFILITFNDPGTKFLAKTRDRNYFRNQLASIRVRGGGDCPEYSMSGIEQALKESRRGSYIYVFTDASAQDHQKYAAVKNSAIDKQCQIVFILSGHCSIFEGNEEVYYKLATDTNGQVFDLRKSEVGKLFAYVKSTITSRKTVLVAKTFPPGGNTLNFTVDGKMKELVISVTGKRPKINVRDAYDEYVPTEDIVTTDNIAVVKVTEVKPGIYKADVSSESDIRVVVTGTTTVHFQHGFSGFKPSSLNDTTTSSISGQESYLSLKLTTKDKNIQLTSVQIWDMNNKVLLDKPLDAVDVEEQFYVTEPFVPPNFKFQIAMKGFDSESGTEITRISLTPIEPQAITVTVTPRAPKVSIVGNSKIFIDYEEPLQLKCKVNAYPKPTITWEDNNGILKTSIVSLVKVPYEYISVLEIAKVDKNNTYKCKASNDNGEDKIQIDVETKKTIYFDVLESPKDTTIEYGKNGRFICKIHASPPALIKWYKNDKLIREGSDFEISPDKSALTIKRMHPKLAGKYFCKAKNNHRRKKFTFKVSITGVERPLIKKGISEIRVTNGSEVNITCTIINGKPEPRIRWYYQHGLERQKRIEGGKEINIKNVIPDDAGTYMCVAVNAVGEDYYSIDLIWEYPPIIKETPSIIRVNEGDQVVLPCEVEGEPTPNIIWFANDVKMKRKPGYHFRRDYLRFKPTMYDNGTYTCKAENKLGSANKTIRVEINVPATIDPPKEIIIEVNVGEILILACDAHGYPQPDVQWIFRSSNLIMPPKFMKPHDSSGSLVIERIQINEHGYYTCEASNAGGKFDITYEVKVYAPPLIVNTSPRKELVAVLGDLVLNVPCKAIGYPTPDITWMKEGLGIPSDSPWYNIEKDGNLTIKNPDKDSAGNYVCQATNALGRDDALYEVIVEDAPKLGPVTKSLLLEEGKLFSIDCPIPHKETDMLRWYKDGKAVEMSKLNHLNVTRADAGVYICRVSSFSGANSGNVEVRVGFKPKFLTEEDKHVEFEEGVTASLVCKAEGEPAPKVTWWHDGVRMSEKSTMYMFQMKIHDRGEYYCLLKNNFGYIVRAFEISSKECLLNIESDFKEKQPLMLSPDYKWPTFKNSDGFLRLLSDEEIILNCPSGFTKFGKTDILATCDHDKNFISDGNTYKFSDYKCKDEFKPITKQTGTACLANKNTETIKIGFETSREFIDVYEVCFDKDKKVPIYAKQNIYKSLSNSELNRTVWYESSLLPFDFDKLYDCELQINTISSVLGKWFHSTDNCCFSKRQLVNPRDVPPGLSQLATYNYLNVIPQWSTCASDNWEAIEKRVRNMAKTTDEHLLIWTGVSELLQLDGASSLVNIDIIDIDSREQPVPRYLWKVVQHPRTLNSLAIIQLNIPDIQASKAYHHVRCRDICSEVDWMKSATWRRASRGYTYCCSVQDFEQAFGYEGLFGSGHRDILY